MPNCLRSRRKDTSEWWFRIFYRPPYVGGRSWVGIEVDRVSDKELAQHVREAWKLIASSKLLLELEQK